MSIIQVIIPLKKDWIPAVGDHIATAPISGWNLFLISLSAGWPFISYNQDLVIKWLCLTSHTKLQKDFQVSAFALLWCSLLETSCHKTNLITLKPLFFERAQHSHVRGYMERDAQPTPSCLNSLIGGTKHVREEEHLGHSIPTIYHTLRNRRTTKLSPIQITELWEIIKLLLLWASKCWSGLLRIIDNWNTLFYSTHMI